MYEVIKECKVGATFLVGVKVRIVEFDLSFFAQAPSDQEGLMAAFCSMKSCKKV